jgi:hypothetical protein
MRRSVQRTGGNVPDPKKELTAADVAKMVKRTVVEKDADAGLVEKQVAVSRAEVLAWRDYGDRVVVITTDGQKLTGKAG